MTESKDILRQGDLILRSGLLKQKHKRWCQLCKEIGEPICLLECFESKDQRDKVKNSFLLSQVKTIDKVVKESSKDYFIDVHMKKDKFSLIFNNQVETESWYNSLQENCQFCEGREDSSCTGDDDSGMKDNSLYVSQPEAVRFDITLKQNDDTKRLNLKSTYRLHVSNVCLMLEDLEKQEPKYKWYYDQLRRYGKTGNDFTIESGRRSESGEGIFVFIHENPTKILKSIDKLTKRKHNEQLTTKLNFSQSESEQNSTNRSSEPICKQEVSPISPKKASSLKDKDDKSSKAPIIRQQSAKMPVGFKNELEETMNKGKTMNERSQKSKKEKQEEKNRGFGFTFFKPKEKDKKSKDAKNEQVNEKELRQYPKENLYDEPEMSPEIIKQSEPIYEEADQDITPFRPAKGKQPLSPPVEPSLYSVAIPTRQHAWKNHGLQEEEHLKNDASIKAAASQKGERNSYKHVSEEEDDTYDHAFLNDKNRLKKKDESDSKNIYGTASGKTFQIPEVDYEGAYELQDDEELVEYDDAVSTQQMMKCYKPPPVTEAYEDVDLPSQ